MPRRTKIVATLGPATDDLKVLDEVIAAGVDVVRLNLSHGSHEEHAERAETIRNRCRASGRRVGVLADLQGPKIRIGSFKNGPVQLDEGDQFVLDTALGKKSGNAERVSVTYKGAAGRSFTGRYAVAGRWPDRTLGGRSYRSRSSLQGHCGRYAF